jgi:hypothetical protein
VLIAPDIGWTKRNMHAYAIPSGGESNHISGGMVRGGGTAQLRFGITDTYGFGAGVGVLATPTGGETCLDIVAGWDFKIGHSNVTIPFDMLLGFSYRWETSNQPDDLRIQTGLQFGPKIRLSDHVGITALFHFGFQFENGEFPYADPFLGGRIGPVFYF